MMLKFRSGQGLLETIIALGIVLVGVVSGLTVVVTSISGTRAVGDRAIATQLAREGIEAVRMIRDSNWLALEAEPGTVVWDSGLESGTDYTGVPVFDPATQIWTIDFIPNDLAANKARLFIDSNGVYRQCDLIVNCSGLEATSIRRLLTLTEICGPVDSPDFATGTCGANFDSRKIGIKAVSTVQVGEGSDVVEVIVEEHLYQWKTIEP